MPPPVPYFNDIAESQLDRVFKTDPDIHPVYQNIDEASMAHLPLELPAYRLVKQSVVHRDKWSANTCGVEPSVI